MDPVVRRRRAAAHVIVEAHLLVADRPVPLDEATDHHLRRVLRLRAGAPVTVTDGRGRWGPTVLMDGAMLAPSGPLEQDVRASPPFTIASAIPKGDRVDVLTQKVAEIGADRLVLLHAARSVVRWEGERATRHVARLQRIADEACRQSRRVWRMSVEGPVESASLLVGALVAEPGGRNLTLRDDLVAIGPEGGWSDGELELAADTIDLGPGILRTETAAIVATTRWVALHH